MRIVQLLSNKHNWPELKSQFKQSIFDPSYKYKFERKNRLLRIDTNNTSVSVHLFLIGNWCDQSRGLAWPFNQNVHNINDRRFTSSPWQEHKTKIKSGGGGGVLYIVLYEDAPPRGPIPYPFIYHVIKNVYSYVFHRKRYAPLFIPRVNTAALKHLVMRKKHKRSFLD